MAIIQPEPADEPTRGGEPDPGTSRPYSGLADLARMRALLMAGRRVRPDSTFIHPGDLVWWLRELDAAARADRIRLWPAADGQALRAWSLLSPAYGAFDLFVHPDLWGAAEHAALWRETAAAMEGYQQARGQWSARTMWVFADDPVTGSILAGLGYRPAEDFLHYLTRPLDERPEAPVLPAGYTVRPLAGPEDIPARTAASFRAFRPDGQLTPALQARRDQDYGRLLASPGYDPSLDLIILAPDGQVAAFALAWLDEQNGVGEFEPVGVVPAFQRLGLGRAVLQAGLLALRRRGMARAIVYAEADNPAAFGLYTAVSFQPVNRILTYEKRWG